MNKQKTAVTLEDGLVIPENEAFRLPVAELGKKLKTDFEQGLTQQEAQRRLQQVGPNTLPKVGASKLKVYLEPLANWLIIVYLLVSAVLAFLAFAILPQLWFQIAVWLPIITGNVVVIVVQSARAEKGLSALQKLSNPKSNVKRDGKLTVVPSDELVPGDIVILKQGDLIPTDARIISSSLNLRINEAILTGESYDVEKSTDAPILEGAAVLQSKSSLFLGTSVVTGNTAALVVETGKNTQIGKMAGKLRVSSQELSLRKRINTLAKNLTFIILIYLSLSVVYSIATLYMSGRLSNATLIAQDLSKSLITSLNVMPISIPLLVTIIMLAGALYMVKSNVIIRNLNSIESAGRLSVLCTDKTGTITQNRMTAKWVYTPCRECEERLYYITSPESPDGGRLVKIDLSQGFKQALEKPQDHHTLAPLNIEDEKALEYLLAAALLNNDSPLFEEGKDTVKACEVDTHSYHTSDATDIAMLCLFERSILEAETYTSRYSVLQSWPLDPKTKLITKIFKDQKTEGCILFAKGATESLLQRCDRVLSANGTEALTEEDKNRLLGRIDLFSQRGQRIVSFAVRQEDHFEAGDSREKCERSLTYVGFVAITDPPREGVREAVSELKNAGIKPVMITGDSATTAASVAKEIGLMDEDAKPVEGSKIKDLSNEEFLDASVFARTSPDDKRFIVGRYKEQSCVVGMTGDGVNDAAAILAADVGIAMGASGTDVARQAAGVVLADDSFNSIVAGIREGRGVFEKIQNIVFFYIAISLAEGLVFFAASFARDFLLLQTWQLIYIAVTQFAPSIALVTDKLNIDVMKEKPRVGEGLVSGRRRTALVVFAVSLAAVLALAYVITLYDVIPYFEGAELSHALDSDWLGSGVAVSLDQARARTMLLSVAIIAQSVLVLSLRRLNKPMYKSLKEDGNWKLAPLVLGVPVFHALLMYIPPIQNAIAAVGLNLGIVPLELNDWLVVLAFGLLPVALLELTKLSWIRKDKQKQQLLSQAIKEI